MTSIILSKEHGLNPAIPKCFYCMKDKNQIILAGRMKEDMEAPRNTVWDMEPCDECQGYMDQGVLLISVRDGEMEKIEKSPLKKGEMPNPYRTGGWAVVRDAVIQRMINNQDLVNHILRVRWAFVPDQVWDAVGLPR